jgi:hypothetical protein
MAINTKNADDAFLRFRIVNAAGPDPLQRWVLVEWSTSLDALLDPTLGLRTPSNSWPYDFVTQSLATEYATSVPFHLYVPEASWNVLKQARVLYYRLGYGSDFYDLGTGAWTWYAPDELIVNHSPEATAGPPAIRVTGLDGRIADPLVLDASGSLDVDMSPALEPAVRDPGPLSFKWELVDGSNRDPALTALLDASLPSAPSAQPMLTVLPAGTFVPGNSLGPYTFRVTARDTDTPLPSSTPGVSEAEVQHTLQAPTTGVAILAPTSLAPRTFQFSDELDVAITYRLAADLLDDPLLAGGYRCAVTIVDAATSTAVATRSTPVPEHEIEGHFHWDGVHDDLSPPLQGTLYDVQVELLDPAGGGLDVPDRVTSDRQENAIQLQVTAITLDSPLCTAVVEASGLEAGTAQVDLVYGINVPAGAQAPDAITLEVSDDQEQVIGELPLPPGALGAGSWTWDGFVHPPPAAVQPGIFDLRLVAKRGGAMLSRSNRHRLAIVRVVLDVASPGHIDAPGVRTHVIQAAGPTMPTMTVDARADGLPAAEAPAVVWDLQLEVVYTTAGHGNVPARNDRTHVGDTIFSDANAGPSAANWHRLPQSTPARWVPDWSTRFCGGELVVHWRAEVRGTTFTGSTETGAHRIHGQNPPKATIRAAMGSSFFTAMAYQESRFTQFRDSSSASALNTFDPGPFTVLRSFDEGYGIGQLTVFPIPTIDQLWSWAANAAEAVRHLTENRTQAIASMNATRAAHAGLRALTDAELDLNAWCRYNSGASYHVYDAATNDWARRAPPSPGLGSDYADAVRGWQEAIDAGTALPGFD